MPRCSLTALSVPEELTVPPREPGPLGKAAAEAELREFHRQCVLDKWLLYNESEIEKQTNMEKKNKNEHINEKDRFAYLFLPWKVV